MIVRRAYTLIELMITMTIVASMAIFGIFAFQSYGQKSIFDQRISEVEALVNQLDILTKNPEQDALSYCLNIATDKITLYKGIDENCKQKSIKSEITLLSDYKIIDKVDRNSYHYLKCNTSNQRCLLRQNEASLRDIDIQKKTFFFGIGDSKGNIKYFFLSINPFNLMVE